MYIRVIVVVASALLLSCNYNEPKQGHNMGPSNPSDMVPGFQSIQQEVLGPYCAKCHDWTASYSDVLARLQHIDSMVQSGQMPLGGGMPADMKVLLIDWIQQGAPEDATARSADGNPMPAPDQPGTCSDSKGDDDSDELCCATGLSHNEDDDDAACDDHESPKPAPKPVPAPKPQPNPKPDPRPDPQPQVAWAEISRDIFVPYCSGCHGDPETAVALVLKDYADVVAVKDRISEVVRTDYMPQGSALPETLKKTLLDWISAGADQ